MSTSQYHMPRLASNAGSKPATPNRGVAISAILSPVPQRARFGKCWSRGSATAAVVLHVGSVPQWLMYLMATGPGFAGFGRLSGTVVPVANGPWLAIRTPSSSSGPLDHHGRPR